MTAIDRAHAGSNESKTWGETCPHLIPRSYWAWSRALAHRLCQAPSYGPTVICHRKKLAASAIAEAQKNNWNVAVAIVDNHGFLVYYEMMDDTQTGSAGVAVDKARSSAMFRRPTRAFEDAVNKGGRRPFSA